MSADEVPRGKPAPDVYLEAAAARAAGMKVVAVPNRQYADPGQLAGAELVLPTLLDFRPEMLPILFEAAG